MRAVIVNGKMNYSIIDVKEPSATPGRVVMSVTYASLCYRDLLELMGYYPRMRFPVVLGHEAVGVIAESMDPRYKAGDRVVPMLYEPDGTCDMCLKGEEVYCRARRSYGEDVDGFFAEKASISGNALVKVPPWISDELADLTPCVLGESMRSLRMGGRLVLIGNVNPDEAYEFKLGYAIMKDISIIGNVAAHREDIWRTFELMRIHAVEPVVSKYGLEDFGKALDDLRSGRKIGKILLKP